MARIIPTDWRTLEATGAAAREVETLALFDRGLPDELTVLHGVARWYIYQPLSTGSCSN